MRKLACFLILALIIIPVRLFSQSYIGADGTIKCVVIKDPYTDSRSGPELLKGPNLLEAGGLADRMKILGCVITKLTEVKMPDELEREYGEWNRAAHTNKVLNKIISGYNKDEQFYIGLLSGSKSVIGMLGGLQRLGPDRQPLKDKMGREIKGLPRIGRSKPLKVGLVWIDSRGAFSTPDITLEGEMGDMNVAAAAGMCNMNLRIQAGLDPPVSTRHIVMAGVRNTTAYEDFNIDNSFIEKITVDDIKYLSSNIEAQMERLSRLTDIIYVHVDMSVLDPSEIPGHPRAFANGPSSRELASCLEIMFRNKKAAALGIASLHDNAMDISVKAAYTLIEGAIKGIKKR